METTTEEKCTTTMQHIRLNPSVYHSLEAARSGMQQSAQKKLTFSDTVAALLAEHANMQPRQDCTPAQLESAQRQPETNTSGPCITVQLHPCSDCDGCRHQVSGRCTNPSAAFACDGFEPLVPEPCTVLPVETPRCCTCGHYVKDWQMCTKYNYARLATPECEVSCDGYEKRID